MNDLDGITIAGALLAVVLLALMYCLPMLIAQSRQHPQRNTIAILNFFFGWTGIGWIGTLAWALSEVRPASSTGAS